ncbi:YqgE/AlgH family protein [Marinobacterium jannaschii]|uniref:YqgE/AlgH family protein n=1 Tax=Marinobacterium jannaschii TaxID=64970 RepID=UPI00047FFEC9|nr:YqgE/AlgH family protein [Marinobacterium jannaschii]
MSAKHQSLRGHFLLSMPHLDDPHFGQSVTYICDHNEYGAMGIVINRPLNLDLFELFSHLEMPHQALSPAENCTIFDGGPVRPEHGFVLHPAEVNRNWLASYEIDDGICLTSSLDILEAIAGGEGPQQFLIALGYAGWAAGQLEHELAQNSWLSCSANLDIMFRQPAEERLHAAAATLGVNLDLLTAQPGHA